MPKEPLTEGRKHILRHWRNFRPKYYKYLKELDALKEAVEMAIRNQSNMEKAMLKAGVDSSTARLESWHFPNYRARTDSLSWNRIRPPWVSQFTHFAIKPITCNSEAELPLAGGECLEP